MTRPSPSATQREGTSSDQLLALLSAFLLIPAIGLSTIFAVCQLKARGPTLPAIYMEYALFFGTGLSMVYVLGITTYNTECSFISWRKQKLALDSFESSCVCKMMKRWESQEWVSSLPVSSLELFAQSAMQRLLHSKDDDLVPAVECDKAQGPAMEVNDLQGSLEEDSVQSASSVMGIFTMSWTTKLSSVGKRLPVGVDAALTHGLSNSSLDPFSSRSSPDVLDAGTSSCSSPAMDDNDAADSSNSMEDSNGNEAELAATAFLTIPGISNLSSVPILGSAVQHFSPAAELTSSDYAAVSIDSTPDGSHLIPAIAHQSSTALPGAVMQPNYDNTNTVLTVDGSCQPVKDAGSPGPGLQETTSLQGKKWVKGLHRVSSAFELKIKAFGPTRDPVDSILEAVSDEAETVVETGGSPVGDAASNSRRLRLIPAALCTCFG